MPSRPWDDWKLPATTDLEQLVAGRGLAIAGGAALIMGAIFFLGLAFSRGWIGPELRVVIGLLVGIGLFGLGAWLLRRDQAIVAHVIVAVGLGVFSLALFAATRLYGLISPELGVGAALIAAVAAAVLAIRANAQLIAGFGLIAVLGSPPVMGASANITTLLFLGAALVGTTGIALYRTWSWLPSLAFLLAAPQLASYVLGDPSVALALPALALFWALNAVAAGGEELRIRSDVLRVTSATLLIANAAFSVWACFALLTGGLAAWQGLYLVVLALAHGVVGAYFLVRGGLWHPFGMLAAGTGIAALTLAVPIQLGAPWVPMAWAAEAVALTWLYDRRRHIYAGLSAAVLGALAAGHLVVIQYPYGFLVWRQPDAFPFANSNGAALGFVLLAMLLSVWLLHERPLRVTVAATAGLLLISGAAQELRHIPFAALLGVMGVGAVLVERRLMGIRLLDPARDVASMGDRALYVTAAVAGANLAIIGPAGPLPISDVWQGLAGSLQLPTPPFINEASAVMVIAVGSALAVTFVTAAPLWRQGGLLLAAAGIAFLLPSQLAPTWGVATWAIIVLALFVMDARLNLPMLRIGVLVGAGLAAAEILLVVVPIVDVWHGLRGSLRLPAPPFSNAASAATAIFATAALAGAFVSDRRPWREGAILLAAASIAYLLPSQVSPAWSVTSWMVIVVALHVVGDRLALPVLRAATLGGAGLAVVETLLVIAPPTRLIVRATPFNETMLLNGGTLAVAAVMAALAARAFLPPSGRDARWAGLAAGVAGVYLLSIGTVDIFQAQLGGTFALEELQKQAQVALSVLWAVIGVAAMVVGLARSITDARLAGLALLALVTVKVFVVDLAALDVAYRVLSFVALGVFLLGAAYLYRRMQHADRQTAHPRSHA